MSKPEEIFQALLEGEHDSATPEGAALATLASALAPAERRGPSAQFKARLRSELLAKAAAAEEAEQIAFAALLEGAGADAPAELRELVTVAKALEPSTLPAPAPAFRYQLRNQLATGSVGASNIAARAWARVAEVNTRLRRSFRLVTATGTAAVMLAGSGATMASAQNALPVDTLYPIKMMKERAELVFPSGAPEGFVHLEHARTRVVEIRGMLDRPVSEQAPYVTTLRKMDDQTSIGQTEIFQEFKDRHAPRAAVERVDRFARAQLFDLASLRDRLPAGARPAATDSMTVLAQVIQRASTILTCPCDAPASALEPAPSKASGERAAGCACDQPSGNGGSTSSDPSGNGGTTPEPDDGDPAPPPDPDDPRIVPDVPGQSADDEADELLKELLNELPPLPTPITTPTPVPTVSLPPVPTVPSVVPTLL